MNNDKRIKYTKKKLEQIVKTATSYSDVCRKLNLDTQGGFVTYISRRIRKFNIDTSHFVGRIYNKGYFKRDIQEYLSNRYAIHSHKLRNRLIKEGYLEHKCYECNKTEWFGKPIPIELHHKDCDHSNNNLFNLIILCRNCHAIEHTMIKNYKCDMLESNQRS